MARLEGKVALVTGSAQGIGATLALARAGEVAKLLVSDIADCAQTVGGIEQEGGGPIGVAMIGSRRRYLEANPAFQSMTGYSEAELNRLSPADITHEVDQAVTEEIIRANSAGESYALRTEKRYLRKDGRVVWAEVDTFLAPAPGGPPLLAPVGVDITERKRAEEDLRKAQLDLAHASRLTALGELTASIAHEVNQPLAAVVSGGAACLRWLDRGTPNLDEARRAAEWIIKEGNRASDVIRRVRALMTKTETQKAPLDINGVVKEVVTLVRRELTSRNISLRTELAPALLAVVADRIQLQQVLINLVMNAIDAMETVRDRPRELVIRSNMDEANQLLVTVEDSGIGISADNAERLFNPFFTPKSSGMGMGLSICRSIIEAHGGRLSAANNAGLGATFQFTLPLHQEHTS
jgi:PAS domain S-box-containing protein